MKIIECSEPIYTAHSIAFKVRNEYTNKPIKLVNIQSLQWYTIKKLDTSLFMLSMGNDNSWFYNNESNLYNDIERIQEALYLETPEGKREQMTKIFLKHLNKTLGLLRKDANYKVQLLIKLKLAMLQKPSENYDNDYLLDEIDKIIIEIDGEFYEH